MKKIIIIFCFTLLLLNFSTGQNASVRPSASYDPKNFANSNSYTMPNDYVWKEIARNMAAVSGDCPYILHGPPTSLSDCEAACANQTLCNVINYNPSIPDCVFRACQGDSLDPKLTRAQGYSVYGIAKTIPPMPDNSSLVKLVSSEMPLSQFKGRNITFFGDSITWLDYYITDLAEAIGDSKYTKTLDINLVNRGINGGTIQDIRDGGSVLGVTYPSFSQVLQMDDPAVVAIQIGINDVWFPTRNDSSKLPEFEAILTSLIKEVQSMNRAIYIATVSVIGEKRDGQDPHDATLDAFAKGQVAVAGRTGIHVSNLRQAYLDYDLKWNANDVFSGILTYDGVHPTGYGARLLANYHAQGLLNLRK